MEIRISRKSARIIIYLLLIVVTALIAFLFQAARKEATGNNIYSEYRKNLRDEFDTAYKEKIDSDNETVNFDLEASEGTLEIVDGYETKVWNYNGTVPGPEIRIKLGQTLRVNFTNNLDQETTIHWHGVRVPNDMDGVPEINQKPISSGKTFTYKFTPKDAGTFWFHPHVRGSEQIERGLFGTLIVEDEEEYPYSQDVVWVLDDWRLTENNQVSPYFVTPHDLSHDGRWGSTITVNGNTDEKLLVAPGERIRLRMVNTSNGRVYKPNFGKLNAKIIAVDGLYTKEPIEAKNFELAPGNRIDVDIKIPDNDERSSYTIFDYYTRNTNSLGTIVIEGEKVEIPDFEYPNNTNIPEWDSANMVSIDEEYILDAKSGPRGINWTINGKAYPNYDPIQLDYNEFNKIKFTNKSYRLHPMHLHGQFFKVLSRNGKKVNEPYFRDTVLVSGQETVVVGIIPLDKGNWASHCHILEHADSGMMTVVEVK